MPIYEYQCASCHHELELMQKINDEPAKQCPQCLQNSLVRLVSAAGFQLKGTGWYATDFKDKGKPAKKTEGSAVASDTSSSEQKTAEKATASKGEKD